MATITPNKIATHSWCNSTMGTGKLVYNTNSKCVLKDNINQDTSTYFVAPISTNSGAVPNSIIPFDSTGKCVKEEYVDGLYRSKFINVNTNIHYNSSTPITENSYSINIEAIYENCLYPVTTNTPWHSNIYTNLTVNVEFYYHKSNPMVTDSASMSYTIAADANFEGTMRNIIYSQTVLNTAIDIGSNSGNMSVANFMKKHLKKMYNYYKSNDGNILGETYIINVTITPKYSFKKNTPLEPHKHICAHNISTSSFAGSASNALTCTTSYICTSGPDFVNAGTAYSWNYTITMKNFTPTITSSPASYITLSNGSGADSMVITRNDSYNSTSKTLTITGTVTCNPNSNVMPQIKIEYTKVGYVPYIVQFSLNLRE